MINSPLYLQNGKDKIKKFIDSKTIQFSLEVLDLGMITFINAMNISLIILLGKLLKF
jgi:hypothetical protein